MFDETPYRDVIFTTLGGCVAANKDEFVDLLKESGVSASVQDSDQNIVDKFIENIGTNPALLIGSAYLCAYSSTNISFDGDKVVDNATVHKVGKELYNYFDMGSTLVENQSNLDWGNVASGVKNVAGGLKSGGWAGGIGSLVESVGGKKLQESSEQKRSKRPISSAGVDMLRRKQEAKQQMIQGVLAAQKAQADAAAAITAAHAKKKKTIYIVAGVSAAVVLTVTIILLIRAKKKK